MSTWRMAGLNYVNYSNIAAKILRKSLKADLRVDAARRDESLITVHYWTDGVRLADGQKPGGDVPKSKS